MMAKKNTVPSPQITRKSERLETVTMSPPVTRNSESIEEHSVPTPLRRFEKGKKLSSPSSSGWKTTDKTSGSSDIEPKMKSDQKPVVMTQKKLNGRAFKEFFKLHAKKVNTSEHDNNYKDSDSKVSEGKGSQVRGEDIERRYADNACESTLEGFNSDVKESVETKAEQKVRTKLLHAIHSVKKPSTVCNATTSSKPSTVYDAAEKNLHRTKYPDADTSLGRGGKIILSEDIRNTPNMGSDVYDVVGTEANNFASPDAIISLPSMCKSKVQHETFKRQRVDIYPEKQDDELYKTEENVLINESNGSNEGNAVIITGHKDRPNKDIQQNGYSFDGQRDEYQNTCFVCKCDGKLLCCQGSGCKRGYHLFCTDPPFKHVPLGLWHCLLCVQKKIQSGVHSVSEGVESILDRRETEVSNDNVLQMQKQYFVKYRGLAHVHNLWVPESKLIAEAPSLIARYNRKAQTARWKQEWAVPHRLLQKRLLKISREANECYNDHATNIPICHYEWLVKWCGLDYKHSSWELETDSLFNSVHGRSLIDKYENRQKKAKRTRTIGQSEDRKEDLLVDLSHFSTGSSSGFDFAEFVKKLQSCCHITQNAVVYNEQERIMKVIAFISSLASNVCQPFLVISTSSALSLWDAEFMQFAPGIDVVAYNGNKKMRESIRTLEFYDEKGVIMFQVLITTPDVLSEDLDVLECIGWEAIIVDECQNTKISSRFEQIKMLTTHSRILLFSREIKDSLLEYINMLSLLESQCETDDSVQIAPNPDNIMVNLNKRFAKYVVDGGKSRSSRFVEHWVPAQISNIQLEQYCATLLSNLSFLCSSLKNDIVGGLSNTLISTRKCCDHPYIVDECLQQRINKDLKRDEYLNTDIKASGKLQLLDAMLMEIRNKSLRVLVLFQPMGGSGKDLVGYILEDYLCQRFGPDSYVCVYRDLSSSKKHSSIEKFNKENGRFVILLETRACHPSIKLSSIDTVIIFDSNWNPISDLTALQKITFDLKLGPMKVFRLYSSCTMEEKVLILAKHHKIVDNSMQNITHSTYHMLLMWGASYLFDKLAEFHNDSNPTSSITSLFDQSVLDNVVRDFLAILIPNGEDGGRKVSFILEVKQNQGTYRTDFPLFGEPKVKLLNENLPHIFWTELLKGKYPLWKYCTVSLQRNRKSVQRFDGTQNRLEVESDEAVKKRRKVVSESINPPSENLRFQKEMEVDDNDKNRTLESEAHTTSQSSSRSTSCMFDENSGSDVYNLNHMTNNISESEVPGNIIHKSGGRKLCDSQKYLYILLKPEIAKLCEVLHLPEDVKSMVEEFLYYVMNNHLVYSKSETMLQAFQISLCWTVATLLKHKIDHKESLVLAKKHLNYSCKNEEAYYFHSLLCCLKKVFLHQTENWKLACFSKEFEQSAEAIGRGKSEAILAERTFNMQRLETELGNMSRDWKYYTKGTIPECRVVSDFHLAQMAQTDISESIERIKKKCHKQMKNILEKQKEEKDEVGKKYNEAKARLENKKKMEATIIRILTNIQMRTDKLKKLEIQYEKQFEELKHDLDTWFKSLEVKQLTARNKVSNKEAAWVEGVMEWAQNDILNPPLDKISVDIQCPDDVIGTPGNVNVSDIVAYNYPIDKATSLVTSSESVELDTIASEVVADTGFQECHGAYNSGNGQENVVYMNPSSEQPPSIISDKEATIRGISVIFTSSNDQEDALQMTCSPQQQILRGTVSSGNSPENAVSRELNVKNIMEGTKSRNEEIIPMAPVTLVEGVETIAPLNSIILENQSPDASKLLLPEENALLRVPDIVESTVALENNVYLSPPSKDAQFSSIDTSSMSVVDFPKEVLGASLNEVMRGNNTSTENLGSSTVASDNAIGMSQEDGESCALNQEFHAQELPPNCLEPAGTSQVGFVPSNQGVQGAYHLPSRSDGIQSQDAGIIQKQNIWQVDVPPSSLPICSEALVQYNQEGAVVSDQGLQNVCSLPTTSAEIQVGDTAASHKLVENRIELCSQVVQQPPTSVTLHSPTATHVVGVGCVSNTSSSPIPCSSNNLLQDAIQSESWMPLSPYDDPLRNELERIHEETEKIVNIHEETRKRLQTELDKEIEHALSQIRLKYKVKFREEEGEFRPKMKALDKNYKLVLTSKNLAEAFKSNCSDISTSTSGSPEIQQESPSSFMQQFVPPSVHNGAQRPSVIPGVSSTGLLTSSDLQTATTSSGSLHTASSPADCRHPSFPLVQNVHYPLTRPPVPALPPQLTPDIRATAPYLQLYSDPTLTRGMSSTTVTLNTVNQPETSGWLPSIQNPVFSSVELPTNIINQPVTTVTLSERFPQSFDLGFNGSQFYLGK